MTEKRFISKDESIINVATDELVNASSEESAKILVNWLNELSDKYAKQRKEDCGLLDGIAFYKEENASLSERISDLECNNEQLKKELKIYHKVANCSNCAYHNYDWYVDDGYGGEEFEVCDKGNDMSDRICEDWEEL